MRKFMPRLGLKIRDPSVMANEEIHASSRFARSLVEKIVKNENLKAMDASKLRRERMGMMGRVPDVVREQKEEAYSPSTISIGPLHKGKKRLEDMEAVKLSYTHALFGRVGALEETMEHYAAAMLEMEEDVWNSYDPASLPPKTQESVRWLAEVILIDACFILELLWRYHYCRKGNLNDFTQFWFDNNKYRRDLVLLENQIPFSVLQNLFELTVEKIPSQSDQQYSLREWVINFFTNTITDFPNSVENTAPYHILRLLHIYFQPQRSNYIRVDERKYDEIEKMERRIKYSATQLRLAGVEFKRGDETNQFNIKFTTTFSFISCWFMFRKGRFEIPPFCISDGTESFLRNLIALELSCPSIGSHFTSFAFFMDLLIDTPEDVTLLKEAGIIDSYLGSDEEVARLFNCICSNVTTASGFHFSREYQEAMEFCKHPCRVAIKNLRQDYFGNPWTGISVIAAISLFVLTFISTLYTMLSYYH